MARHAGEMINELTLAMVAKQSVSVLFDDSFLSHSGGGVAQNRRRLYVHKINANGEESFRKVVDVASGDAQCF